MEKIEDPSRPHGPDTRQGKVTKAVVALLCLCICLFNYVLFKDPLQLPPIIDEVYSHLTFRHHLHHRSHQILKHNPLIDGHNDLAILIRAKYANHIYGENFTKPFEQGGLQGNVDIPRMDKGHYSGAFMSAFWLCPADPYDFSSEAYGPVVKATLEQLDVLKRLSAQYPDYFPETRTVKDAKRNFKEGRGVTPLAIEGLHQVGSSFATLRLYHEMGVRYSTLNWNCHNIYSDAAVLTFLSNFSSIPAPPLHGGISLTGRRMIREMNRLGMIVDLAHVSVDTMRDALIGQHNDDYPLPPSPQSDGPEYSRVPDADGTGIDLWSREDMWDDAGQCGNAIVNEEWTGARWFGSLAPPIISHSSAKSLCPHPRNVPDDVLQLVKDRRSVVMVNFNPDFLSCHYAAGQNPETELPTTDFADATLGRVADHIMHIGDLIGWDHVGIGSDFDGIEQAPKGLEGVDKMPALVEELLRREVSEKDIIKMLGGNVLRVWQEAEEVAEKLQKMGVRPAEDDLPRLGALEELV